MKRFWAALAILPAMLLLVAAPRLSQSRYAHSNWKQTSFITTYCCAGPASEQICKQAAQEHFNYIPAPIEALDYAKEHGLKVILQHGLLHPKTALTKENLRELGGLVDTVKNHPALGGYYLYDEPVDSEFAGVMLMAEQIRKHDPAHFAYVNMLPLYGMRTKNGQSPAQVYSAYLRDFAKAAKPDLLSFDFYPFRQAHGLAVDLDTYFVNLAVVREAARKARIPFVSIIQACQFTDDWRLPTPAELRWQVYTNLAYGSRGINYFLYWGTKDQRGIYRDGKPSEELLAAIINLNEDLEKIGPEIINLSSTAVYHTTPLPPGTVPIPKSCKAQIVSKGQTILACYGSSKYNTFMIVNRDLQRADLVKLKLEGAQKMECLDRIVSRWRGKRKGKDGLFTIQLQAGDGQLFRF